MAIIYSDGFDHYGTGTAGEANMLNGIWAATVRATPVVPSFGARTGTHALQLTDFNSSASARRVLGVSSTELIVSFAFYKASMPPNNRIHLVRWLDASAVRLLYLEMDTTGAISLYRHDPPSTNVLLATTGTPVIVNSAWNHVAIRVLMSATVGECEIRVDDVEVLNVGSLNTHATAVSQLEHGNDLGVGNTEYYFDDMVVSDTTGTYNTGFLGDTRVVTLFPDEDNLIEDGWTAHPRRRFGDGVVQLPGSTSMVKTVDNALLDLGSGDFTIEGQVRFSTVPGTSDKAVIFAKWDEDGSDNRSYELYKAGPSLEGGNLVFKVSSDGTSATEAIVKQWPWSPVINQWYHIAVTRSSGFTRLFIDGVQLGGGVPDNRAYFDGSAQFTTGAEVGQATSSFDGFMDEVRLTKGVGRYTANFTPPTENYPRSSPSDPSFASVSLLIGYDTGITDESDNTLALTTSGAAARLDPADGNADFETLSHDVPMDDTFMSASLLPAVGDLSLSLNAAASETVTIGATTYTFVTTLVSANDVLIGGTGSYTSKSVSVNSETTLPQDIFFSVDGTAMFVLGRTVDTVWQYTLSTAWDVSTATYASKSKSVTTEDSVPKSLHFKPDGLSMYIVGTTTDSVYQYTLSGAWDVSTATYASKSVSIGGQDGNPTALAFSVDGTAMYMMGVTSDTLYQYTLSTAWDVSTATYASKSKSVTTEDSAPEAIHFNPDGLTMFMLGTTTKAVYEYSLGVAWDVSTALYTGCTNLADTEDSAPAALFLRPTGLDLFVLGATNDTVYQYVLGSPWHVCFKNETLANLNAAILNSAGEGTVYGTGTTANTSATPEIYPESTMHLTASTVGDAGNTVTTTETLAGGAFSNTTLLGGQDIPDPSQFGFGNLPSDVTAVRSVTFVNRGYKTDSGASKIQVSFVEPGGASATGADTALTTAPIYREDVFEEDPSISGPLTPAAINGGQIKLNRTE